MVGVLLVLADVLHCSSEPSSTIALAGNTPCQARIASLLPLHSFSAPSPLANSLQHAHTPTTQHSHLHLSLSPGEFLALEHGTEFQGYSHIHESEVVESKAHK